MTRTYSPRWLPILEQLESGLLIITASNRQADFLRQQYRYFQSNKNVWHRPKILTDKQWLRSLYQQILIHHDLEKITSSNNKEPWILLSDQESRLIWEGILEKDGDYLLDTRRTAERVRQAANRLNQWLLIHTLEDDSFIGREETERFKGWYQLAQKQFQENNWFESFQLEQWLTKRIELLLTIKDTSLLSSILPSSIGLVGFQQLAPAKSQFFDNLDQAGILLTHLEPESINSEIYRIELPDNREEIKQAAIWAKQHWLKNPEQTLGVVLPNLNNCRELTRITFERVFCPKEMISSNDQVARPFDISLGLALSSYPLIDSAMTLIKLISEPTEQDEVVQLLVSPFYTALNQQSEISAIITLLRKSRQPRFAIKDLLYFSAETSEAETVHHRFKQLNEFVSTGKLAPSQWAINIAQMLENINWADHRKLSSSEYQTKEAWQKKLESMAIYDQLSGNISWSQFRHLLSRIIRETLFQPQTGDCPIQIMGLLEAASLTFDKVRICGIDNRLWPESAKPNPFIPYELQREFDMPNATAERELRVSEQLCKQLSNSAHEVIFSHSKGNGEESLSVSPLLETVELRDYADESSYHSPAKRLQQIEKPIEYIDDNLAPTIEGSTVKGGSGLLQDIARCPFRAFAHHRLFANAADSPREDLDALDRGNLVHRILEQCWLQLFDKQQTNLEELHKANQLEGAIKPHIEEALTYLQQQRHTLLSDAIVKIEFKRLNKLLLQWFEMEISRPAFTVKSLEESVNAPIAGNYIRLQLDRVDELEDGSLAIIDYKTGAVNRNNWFGERPDEPQLPLYAMVLSDQEKTIGALLYAQVKMNENRFMGVALDRNLVKGVAKDFIDEKINPEAISLKEQVTKWRHDLQSLMQEYLNGEASVAPRDEHVCQYCDLHSLCRISELSQRHE